MNTYRIIIFILMLTNSAYAQNQSTTLVDKKIVSSATTPFKFASEDELIKEFNFAKDSSFNKAIIELNEAIISPNSAKTSKLNAERCAPKYNVNNNSALINTPDDIACIPFFVVSQNQITQLLEPPENYSSLPTVSYKNPGQWEKLADKNMQQSFRMLKPKSAEDIIQFMPLMRNSDCRFRNAGASLIAHGETWLPNDAIISAINEIYQKISPCLKNYEDSFERTHLRLGLLRLARNDLTGAQTSLEMALQTFDAKERYRTLFWLGAISASKNINGATNKNPYWETLIKKHPLEIHSIIAAHTTNTDPLEAFLSQNILEATERNKNKESQFNLLAWTTELFIAKNNKESVIKTAEFALKNISVLDPSELLFFAIALNKVEAYRESIVVLSKYLRQGGSNAINFPFLQLYFPRPFSQEILEFCDELDPVIVFSLIRQESAFNPKARSIADARGLMQLLPKTARRYQKITPNALYDHKNNIKIGVKFLEDLMERFSGKLEYVLAAYNAGPANMAKWKIRYPVTQTLLFSDLIPFKETRFYVSNILRNAYWYGRILTHQKDSLGQITMEKSSKAKWSSDIIRDLLALSWHQPALNKSLVSNFNLNQNLWAPDISLLDSFADSSIQEFPELDSIEHNENDDNKLE